MVDKKQDNVYRGKVGVLRTGHDYLFTFYGYLTNSHKTVVGSMRVPITENDIGGTIQVHFQVDKEKLKGRGESRKVPVP